MSGLRIGTRASPLARAQSALVAQAIDGEVQTLLITTSGDRAAGEDKRRWVDEIEKALLEERIDLAVHSAKDVPAQLAEGLALIGAPARADPLDALCGADSLAALRHGARVGTSSPRREAQLRALREDLEVVALHGNLDTRLGRLAAGDFDAIVLARAGLARLGRDGGTALEQLIPAAGQGTLALEARAQDGWVADAVAALRDSDTERALAAERACVRALEADCHTPVGAHARALAGRTLLLRVFVGRRDGSEWMRDELSGEDPVALGEALAERLRIAGVEALLAG